MIELVCIDDVIKGYKDIPVRHYSKFIDQFEFVYVGTTQPLLVTKDSVRKWFYSFTPDRRSAFRDAGYIQHLLDNPSCFGLEKNKKIVIDNEMLHVESHKPFEPAVKTLSAVNNYRDGLIAEKKLLEDKLLVSTHAESIEINDAIAILDRFLAELSTIYSPERLKPYIKGMQIEENASDYFKQHGGNMEHFEALPEYGIDQQLSRIMTSDSISSKP